MNTSDIIAKLRALDLSTYPTNEIISTIHDFDDIKIIRLTISPGAIITRVRKGWGYNCRKELSYPPIECCKTCQRANLPNHTMFYGTISDSETPTIDNRAIAITECSTLTRKGVTSKSIEKFTVSTWYLTSTIHIVAIVDDMSFTNVTNNKMLDLAREKYEEHKMQPNFEEYARFVANEFSKPVDADYDYLISAAISDLYMHYDCIDGIAYPSVRIGGQVGMNIALKPNVADVSLMLAKTAELTYYKNGEYGICMVDRVSDMQTWDYHRSYNKPSDSKIADRLKVHNIDELYTLND